MSRALLNDELWQKACPAHSDYKATSYSKEGQLLRAVAARQRASIHTRRGVAKAAAEFWHLCVGDGTVSPGEICHLRWGLLWHVSIRGRGDDLLPHCRITRARDRQYTHTHTRTSVPKTNRLCVAHLVILPVVCSAHQKTFGSGIDMITWEHYSQRI